MKRTSFGSCWALLMLLFLAPTPAEGADDDQLPTGVQERQIPTKAQGEIYRVTSLRRADDELGRRYYDGRGRLLEETRSVGGRTDGPSRQWYANGKLRSLRTYRQGLMDGPARAWDEQGRLIWQAKFDAGTGVLKSFYLSGRSEAECPYRSGLKHGNERRWHATGNLASDSTFKDGQLDGWTRSYDSDGGLTHESLVVPGIIAPAQSHVWLDNTRPHANALVVP